MRAVRIHKFGGEPQDLVYEENVMQPRPKEGELLVKVYATKLDNIRYSYKSLELNLRTIFYHLSASNDLGHLLQNRNNI